MGLTDTIKAGVAAGFKAGGDVKVDLQFQKINSESYDATTGDVTEDTTDFPAITGFRRSYTTREIESGIADARDKMVMVQVDDCDFLGEDLSVIDRIIMDGVLVGIEIINGSTYQIKDFDTDPAGAIYKIRVGA